MRKNQHNFWTKKQLIWQAHENSCHGWSKNTGQAISDCATCNYNFWTERMKCALYSAIEYKKLLHLSGHEAFSKSSISEVKRCRRNRINKEYLVRDTCNTK